MCTIVKFFFKLCGWTNRFIRFLLVFSNDKRNATVYTVLDGTICDENLEQVCIIPGIDTWKDRDKDKSVLTGLFARTIVGFIDDIGGANSFGTPSDINVIKDAYSIDKQNTSPDIKYNDDDLPKAYVKNNVYGKHDGVAFKNITVTNDITHLIQCIEMKLAEEYKVIQFDFYNDWINGLIYIPRWMRNIRKKHTFLWGLISFGGKVKACNENISFQRSKKYNIVQQCGLKYDLGNNNNVTNYDGCKAKKGKLHCHKAKEVRLTKSIFNDGGIVKSMQNLNQQFLYYFKPCEFNDSKTIKLFATDIILLGSLNNCDKWGMPNNFQEMTSSTFQLPPNLALTDSDVDGREYKGLSKKGAWGYARNYNGDNLWGDSVSDGEKLTYLEHIQIHEGSSNNGISISEENGNYTEVSGIDWGYHGPLQTNTLNGRETNFYKPGGHFLGLSCRNSETTIKSCVNLNRICEYGVWMSQRQTLNIPGFTEGKFFSYATVPSGLISKDEISDTNFRTTFSILNSNRLRTITSNDTGYPIYDFIFNKPTNFGGELNKRVSEESPYNRLVSSTVTETYFEYTDDDDFKRSDDDINEYKVWETQIMRTGEYMDKEYLKFRFGLDESEFTLSQRKKKYLTVSGNIASFPMFENSFYFYFGLKDGSTALDEFKRQYYAVCSKTNSLTQADDTIALYELVIVYDGICEDDPKGEIKFKINAPKEFFGTNGAQIMLRDEKNTIQKNSTAENIDDRVIFKTLKNGIYYVTLTSESGISVTKEIEVGKVNISAQIKSTDFIKDVSDMNVNDIFNADRLEYGGYITFSDNMFRYNRGIAIDEADSEETDSESDIIEEDVFKSKYIKQIAITFKNHSGSISNDINDSLRFTAVLPQYDYTITTVANNNSSGEVMIPVPYADETYSVYIYTYVGTRCKPVDNAWVKDNVHRWHVGDVTVSNGNPLKLVYEGISYSTTLGKYASGTTDINTLIGWWIPENDTNWLEEPNSIQWNIKKGLYTNDFKDSSHSVSLNIYGGVAPYTENITGMKEDAVTTTGITISDIDAISLPTINYINKDGKRRTNFSYQVIDSNNQIYPVSPFVFPVIYKPFFMEIGIWYFSGNKKYYLLGNVYNGKTWDYRTEGFNSTSLNSVSIANICTIDKDDSTMELNELIIDDNGRWQNVTGGGYSYNGKYFKYNSRKTRINREIEPITYGLHNNGVISNIGLSIGCSHVFNDVTYGDNTNASRSDMEFFDFLTDTKSANGKYYVKITTKNKANKLYLILNDADNGYVYPLIDGVPNISENLHKALMYNRISEYTGVTLEQINGETGFIDITNKNNKGSIYYIAIPNNEVDLLTTSSDENKLKAASVSKLINLSSLSDFYPLFINVVGIDILQSNGLYKTEITITPESGSEANFKNKKFELSFYKTENGIQIIMQTITFTTGSDTNEVKIDLTPYRNIIGLSDRDKSIWFYFDVYKGSEKAPTSYLKDSEGKNYVVNFDFTDETSKEETPTT